MAQPAPVPAREPTLEQAHDHIVILRRATWADYQRLLEIRGERSVPRLSYLEGMLEIMTPSKAHEVRKSMIGCLVEAWCVEKGVEITPYGSWTLESKEAERGVEPDECYVIGDVAEPERPDLAIEVIWTSGRLDKLEIHRKLRVREVWIHERGQLEVHALRGEQYEPIGASEVLAGIDLVELAKFVSVQPMTRAVREYRATLRAESSD
jgi:Uma2 family endonuclease